MRIIGGASRGLHLTDVGAGDSAAHLRPTSDRVREAIFNLLINGGYGSPVQGAQILDVFAGTGALGLEAISRGASHATFVENGRTALAILTRNIALLRAEAQTTVLHRDARQPLPAPTVPYDLVFLDPPYGQTLGEAALPLLAQHMAPDALIVWEESAPPIVPVGFERLDQRRYSGTLVSILRKI